MNIKDHQRPSRHSAATVFCRKSYHVGVYCFYEGLPKIGVYERMCRMAFDHEENIIAEENSNNNLPYTKHWESLEFLREELSRTETIKGVQCILQDLLQYEFYSDSREGQALITLCRKRLQLLTGAVSQLEILQREEKALEDLVWKANGKKIRSANERDQTQKERAQIARDIAGLETELSQLKGLFSGRQRRNLQQNMESKKSLLIEKEDRIGDLEKEFEQADEEYKIASSERDSRKPDILYRRGKCYYENSLYKEAYLIFQYIPGYRDVDQILREDCIRRGYQEALCTPGATIRFGSYVQRDGGENPTPIDWVVLKAGETNSLLISCDGLDYLPYQNNLIAGLRWEASSLRKWLNSEFLNSAFQDEEKQQLDSMVLTEESRTGNDAETILYDKVSLLSEKEADHLFHRKSRRINYLLELEDEKHLYTDLDYKSASPTEYAKSKGARSNPEYHTAAWWLRTIGEGSGGPGRMKIVNAVGKVYDYGNDADSPDLVRPVICLRHTNLYELVGDLGRPVWLRGDEQAALASIAQEERADELDYAANNARFYRVRAAANRKLGRYQRAAFEIALHDPDTSVCLAALDETEWAGWEQLLSEIVLRSDKEAVVLKALDKMQDEEAISEVARQSKSETVVLKALEKVKKDANLAAVARNTKNERVVTEALSRITSGKLIASLFDESDAIREIADTHRGEKIVKAKITGDLQKYCCPDGRFHDFESWKEWVDLGYSDDDDMKASKGYYETTTRCKNCKYERDKKIIR